MQIKVCPLSFSKKGNLKSVNGQMSEIYLDNGLKHKLYRNITNM